MKDYNHHVKDHLAKYKTKILGISANGVWIKNKREYPHILPKKLEGLNILEPYREQFWEYKKQRPDLKLHSDFHHLNSSQAMCFNLFFPLLTDEDFHPVLLKDILGCNTGSILEYEFEKVIDKKEGTNLDLFIRLKHKTRIFFEIKYSEQDFGSAKDDKEHNLKLQEIYQSGLRNKVTNEYLESPLFFENYQLLRNIYHLSESDLLFFVFPKGNRGIAKRVDNLDRILLDGYKSKVKVLYLEDMVGKILNLSNCQDPIFMEHYREFGEKYIPMDY